MQNYTNWSTSPYFLEHGIPPSCCMNETDCNPQDLHNLTVAATKVNQKVPASFQLYWVSGECLGGLCCFCGIMICRLERVVQEAVKCLPLWSLIAWERHLRLLTSKRLSCYTDQPHTALPQQASTGHSCTRLASGSC